MGKQIMLVNVHEDETRIALVENNILVGLHVQLTDRERKVGNIYRGKIVKINPAFQAAFIDYGESRNGFLSISDVNFQLHPPKDGEKGRPKIQNVLREGQPVMVQILKEGMSNKGSALTTFVSLAGRYMVMSPHSERSGVSRKIEDPDTRRRLKDIMEALTGGEDLGLIIRTAGIDEPVSELKRDLEALRKEWKGIQSRYDKSRKPGLLYQEPSPIVRVLRDYFTDAVQEVWVDDAEGFQEALRYFKSTLPKYQKRLKLYVGDKSLFSAYRIEEQIESLDSAKVGLKSGGSVVIESTEALVSVDVNSGRSNQASDIEDTALRTNSEAAEEIARQLRLRNLGGLIVIDFIDMMQAKHRKQVEKTLTDALKSDKARTTIGSISQFGLLELSRQRIDMELSRGLRIQCPNCGGTGHIPTVNSSANTVLRKIRELAATGRYNEIHGELPLDAANYLLNEKREALRDLELEFEITLKLEGDPDLPAGHAISLHGAKAPTQDEAEPERAAEEAPERATERDADASERSGDDGGHRRRRRRRRRRRGEGEGAYDSEGGERRDDERREEPDLAADAFDEELEVEVPEEDEALAELVEGEHEFDTPHAELHAEPGAVQRRKPHPAPRAAAPTESAPPGNGQGAGLMFKSEHIITDPEALEKLPPPVIRSNPFRAIAEDIPANSLVYDSARLGSGDPLMMPAGPANGQGAEVSEEEEAPKRKRRRSSRGRGKSASAAEEAPAEAAAPEQAAPPEPALEPEPPAPQQAAPVRPAMLDEEVELDPETGLPDNIGNLKQPPPELVARQRSRTGRGGRAGAKAGGKAAGKTGNAGRKPRGEGRGRQTPAASAGGAGASEPAARRPRSRRGRGRGGRRPAEGGAASAS